MPYCDSRAFFDAERATVLHREMNLKIIIHKKATVPKHSDLSNMIIDLENK